MQACCHQNLSPMNSYPPSKMCSSDIKQPWSQQHPVPKVRAHISQQRQETIAHVCHVMYWSHNLPTSKTRYTRLTQPLHLFIIVEEKETKHISPDTSGCTHHKQPCQVPCLHRAPSLPLLWSFEHPISKSRKLELRLSYQKIFKR